MSRPGRTGDLAIAALVIAVVGMMIVPLPRPLLDVLLAFNLGLTVVLLMAAVFVPEPRRFGSFPTILVVTTLLRVGLNVSTTRLILADADAGEVVRAFGSAVVADNLVVGLVVFAVITIVQLLVVARGAERVAEVSARFALDAMPGRQLAIDADLRAGLIDATAARDARAELTRESQLYGAMDGAMRFVKGDAIAAILIVVINLVGGLIIGIGYHHLDAATAVRTYSLLSIGEGLVAQIPSLVLAVASGLLVTRVASSGDRAVGEEIGEQVFGQSRALGGGALLMAALALVPGLPMLPFLLLAVVFGAAAWWRHRQTTTSARVRADDEMAPTPASTGIEISLGRDLSVLFASDRGDLDAELAMAFGGIRRRLGDDLGVTCPRLRLRTDAIALGGREIRIDLAGVPLAWTRVAPEQRIDLAGVVAAVERSLRQVAHALVGIDEVAAMVASTATTHPILVREVVPRIVALPVVTELVRELVREQVPVRDFASVLGAIATAPAGATSDRDRLGDHVRGALHRQISGQWAPAGQLEVYTVDAMIEDALRGAIDRRDGAAILALEPDLARDIVSAVRTHVGMSPAVVLTSGDVRRHLHVLLEGELPGVTVLAPHELAPGVSIRSTGQIRV